MSDPVTSEEVEDVLSSIRRLVSEDKRPLAGLRNAPAAVPDEGDTAPSDVEPDARLVLTPAHRVAEAAQEAKENAAQDGDDGSDDTSRSSDAPEEAKSNDAGPLDLGSVARASWEQREHAPKEALNLSGHEAQDDPAPREDSPAESEISGQSGVSDDNDSAMDELDALVHDTLTTQTDDAETEDFADYADEGFWEEEEPATEEAPRVALVDMEDEAAREEGLRVPQDGNANLADYGEVPAPEDHSDAPPEAPAKNDDDTAQESHAEPDEDADQHEDVQTAEVSPPEQPESVEQLRSKISTLPLTAKIAALEAAVGKIGQEWEPDGNDAEAMRPADTPAMAWEDDLELDAKGAPVPDTVPDAVIDDTPAQDTAQMPEPSGEASQVKAQAQPDDQDQHQTQDQQQTQAGFASVDDQMMDEETLRDLVTEIVRTELQGALGERITRNVRKLVRREIHRALTAQDME